MILNEFVPGFDLERFLRMPSFRQQVYYANTNLKRISSGSSRIVYEIDDYRVLKLAKNSKGLAQNKLESNEYINSDYPDIIAKVLETDRNFKWLISERSKKVTKSRFKKIVGVGIEEFSIYLMLKTDKHRNRSRMFRPTVDADDIEILNNDEFTQRLLDFIFNYNMADGDFGRKANLGEIDGRLVLVDYGADIDVLRNHYHYSQ
jgi:hypothetical protein